LGKPNSSRHYLDPDSNDYQYCCNNPRPSRTLQKSIKHNYISNYYCQHCSPYQCRYNTKKNIINWDPSSADAIALLLAVISIRTKERNEPNATRDIPANCIKPSMIMVRITIIVTHKICYLFLSAINTYYYL
jgi:hypothetical protein